MPELVSEQARQSVCHIFTQAARAHLLVNPMDTIEIEALDRNTLKEPPEPRLVALTVSSYFFRLLTLFHIDTDPRTVDYFTRGNPALALDEAFGEIGNLCCGAMNRELGRHYSHMGMSTPYTLDGRAFPFIRELRPDFVSQYTIRIAGTLSLHATVCLCAYAPIDFRVDRSEPAEASGELELF